MFRWVHANSPCLSFRKCSLIFYLWCVYCLPTFSELVVFLFHIIRHLLLQSRTTSKLGKSAQEFSWYAALLRRNDCGTTISAVQNPDRINPKLSVQDSPEQKLVCRIWVRVRKGWEYLRQSGHLLCHSKGRDVANLARWMVICLLRVVFFIF